MLGHEIGKLKINRKAKLRYVFIPLKQFNPKTERWDWSRNHEHGEEIRKFLETLRNEWYGKHIQEREIQWQLSKQLDEGKGTDGPFKKLSTVRWVGCPTEIDVSLTVAGNLGNKPGTIDLLVRRLYQINRGTSASGPRSSFARQNPRRLSQFRAKIQYNVIKSCYLLTAA